MSNIISKNPITDNKISTKIDIFLKKAKISNALSKCGFYKSKGIPCVQVLKDIFTLVFHAKNLYRVLDMKTGEVEFQKNTAYRFLNNPNHNWRKLLLLIVTHFICMISKLTSDNRQDVLIIDDSLFDRNRSKHVELLTRVFDHTLKKFVKGFKMLTLGWSDGTTFLPVGFSLLSSQHKSKRVCDINNKIDKRTTGYKRRLEAIKKQTDVLFELLENAKGLPAKYLLFDSWFAFPSTIIKVLEDLKYNVICMLKLSSKVHYYYDGEWLNIKEIYKKIAKTEDKNIRAEIIVGARKNKSTMPVNVKIVFVSDRRSNNWLALLSTDVNLSGDEIIRVYGKRWDIEVFFKMSKSYLALAKEFQGRSYDMMVAHTSIVFLRYIMLAVEIRNSKDYRTSGDLFFWICDEMEDIKYTEALMLLLELLKKFLAEEALLPESKVRELIDIFITSLPALFRERLKISA